MWLKGTKIKKNMAQEEIRAGDLHRRVDWGMMKGGAQVKSAAQFTTWPTKI
jgi:hypothetical protein